MFSTYPDELPGAGLLLLRIVVAAVLSVRGAYLLMNWHDQRPMLAALVLLCAAGSALLVLGYLTRLGALLVFVASLGSSFPHWLGPSFDFFGSKPSAILAMAIAAALICTGPGAWSLDARLFGRHEIIIPRKTDLKPGSQNKP